MGEIFKVILSRIGDSKTYVLLIVITVIALIACCIASAFGYDVWGRLFDLMMGNTVVGGGRAIVNDGLPKVAAAWQDPNSAAANPPSAMLQTATPPIATIEPTAAVEPTLQASPSTHNVSIPKIPIGVTSSDNRSDAA